MQLYYHYKCINILRLQGAKKIYVYHNEYDEWKGSFVVAQLYIRMFSLTVYNSSCYAAMIRRNVGIHGFHRGEF